MYWDRRLLKISNVFSLLIVMQFTHVHYFLLEHKIKNTFTPMSSSLGHTISIIGMLYWLVLNVESTLHAKYDINLFASCNM